MPEVKSTDNKGGKLYRKVDSFLRRLGFREDALLIILAVMIGILTGLGSVGFTWLIDLAHELCYGESGFYGGQGFMLIVLPGTGALLVGVITFLFAREAKGHGVPEVMDAIARRDGLIRKRVALAKAVASALTIGSGGSAGTEGPIIQIGAAIGSTSGRVFQVARHNMPVIVGCGAAAGISAIFHAPIAGVLFALEIFLRELNFKTFSPVMIASVVSSVVVYGILGANDAIFPLLQGTQYSFQWYESGNYVILGMLCALAAVFFIKLLYKTEDFFDWLPVHYIIKPIIGAVGLGLIGLFIVHVVGDTSIHEPSVFGNGYHLIGRCIGAVNGKYEHQMELGIGVLIILYFLKAAATCCTLGSGGSGGVFAPSLFLGAVVGYSFGLAMEKSGAFPGIHPETYALVGMASVVAATTHAPMAAIVILFEMTREYKVILPVMLSATVALVIAQFLFRDSIYTLKLRRRGIHFESRADTALLRRLNVKMVMNPQTNLVYDDTPLQEVIQKAIDLENPDFIVVDHTNNYVGLLTGSDLRAALLQPESVPFLLAGELAHTNAPTVGPDETLDKVLDKFSRLDIHTMAVHSTFSNNEYIGMITRTALMRRYQQELQNN